MTNYLSQLEVAESSGRKKDYLSFQSSSHGIFLFYLKKFVFIQIHVYLPKYFNIVDSEITHCFLVGFLHISTQVAKSKTVTEDNVATVLDWRE